MSPRPKSGLTLVEMLVAMTASLILFGAVVTIFQILGDAVGKSRRTGQLDSDLCSIRTRLQQDLAGATANRDADGLQVEVNSGSVSGYFEIIEGPNSDLLDYSVSPAYNRATNNPGPTAASNDRIVGDTDDLLLFTTRNVTLDPFVGKFGNTTLTAEQAEVAYFCRPTAGTPSPTNPTLYTLYRRQLLIIGGFPRPPFASDGSMPFTSWGDFYAVYDLSARREDLGASGVRAVLNTANDLQRRRNRFAHDPACSGATRDLNPLLPNHPNNVLKLAGTRKDEDVLATNVLSFDVRLLDPQAAERQAPGTVRMQPSDRDYWTTNNNLPTATPVYGDLGFNAFAAFHPGGNTAPGVFSGYGRSGNCLVGTAATSRTYDTWTSFYANNNQDDDNINGPDDAAERAPYSHPLGGIQVVIRLYDPDTKSVRQATVTQSFRQ